MADKQNIVEEAKIFVQKFLLEELPAHFLFHNFELTVDIVDVSSKLAKRAGISPRQKEILLLASVFYISGYTEGIQDNEKRSAKIAREFLKKRNVESETIEAVENLLLRNLPEDKSLDNLSNILHDAVWSFLGRKRFRRKGMLMRLENEKVKGEKYTLRQWNKKLLELQVKTKFLTSWANEMYGTRKNKNIVKQKEELREAKKKTIRSRTGKDFGRGIDTVYRVTLKNHIELSTIADGKANMIISINTLILSILITAITAGISLNEDAFKGNGALYIPILVLLCSALLAIVFAVFSAMPKVSGSHSEEEEEKPDNAKQNMLFFGNFLDLDEESFVAYLRGLKKNQEKLYDDLSRDLFNLGKVLKQKYRLLTVAYRVFVIGLALSLLSFLFIYLIYPGYL